MKDKKYIADHTVSYLKQNWNEQEVRDFVIEYFKVKLDWEHQKGDLIFLLKQWSIDELTDRQVKEKIEKLNRAYNTNRLRRKYGRIGNGTR